jgi:small subunit ribosomal protein S18
MKQAINKSKKSFNRRLPPIRLGEIIDYKNINLLCNFFNKHRRILSRQMNRLTSKQQRLMTIAINQAWFIVLLHFLNNAN